LQRSANLSSWLFERSETTGDAFARENSQSRYFRLL
jgi:hypothetical protein